MPYDAHCSFVVLLMLLLIRARSGAKIVASGTGKLVLPEGMRVLGGKGAQFVGAGAGKIITKGAVKAGSEVSKTVVTEAAVGASAAIEGGIAVAFLVKDSVEYSRGDITGKTLAKRTGRNVVKGGASVGGAVLGQIVIPIPVIGAMAGGLVGSGVGWFAGWGTGLYDEDDLFLHSSILEAFDTVCNLYVFALVFATTARSNNWSAETIPKVLRCVWSTTSIDP